MNPDTGDVYDLALQSERNRALMAMKAGDVKELRRIYQDEIAHLQAMNREDRRAYLRDRLKIDRQALERLLEEEENK